MLCFPIASAPVAVATGYSSYTAVTSTLPWMLQGDDFHALYVAWRDDMGL